MSIAIRPFEPEDWPRVLAILEPVFRAGETYAFPTDMDEAETRQRWIEAPLATFVATDETGAILGTYYLKPNQAGPGGHVCNCGYVVGAQARGRGVAAAMGRHSQAEARTRGFAAMQFNCVVSTNDVAVRLWKRLGFAIVGTLPGAFAHPRHGFVDAYVMFKTL